MTENKDKRQSFSLPLYFLIIAVLSWPFQIGYIVWGKPRSLLLLSMTMVGVGTYIAGKYVFKDGFATVGWSKGELRYYAFACGLVGIFLLVPSAIEFFGRDGGVEFALLRTFLTVFSISFITSFIPTLGEEFGFRGYLLPRLLERYASSRKALFVHGVVFWLWHLPLVASAYASFSSTLWVIAGMLFVGFFVTVMQAIVQAYVWSISQGIFVVTFYHTLFYQLLRSLEEIGSVGGFVNSWRLGAVILVGVWVLWKFPVEERGFKK